MAPDKPPDSSADLIPSFDLDALRLPQNSGEALSVKRIITRVPVRRPIKSELFRTRPGEAWRVQTMILEDKAESETYLLAPALRGTVPDVQHPAVLHAAIDCPSGNSARPIPKSTRSIGADDPAGTLASSPLTRIAAMGIALRKTDPLGRGHPVGPHSRTPSPWN